MIYVMKIDDDVWKKHVVLAVLVIEKEDEGKFENKQIKMQTTNKILHLN